jgi:chromosome segregation ATPase
MKTLVPWIVAALAIAGAAFLYNSNQSKSAEVAGLQQQAQELTGLRAEVDELKKNQVPADELLRLRKNTEELIRLRNSVRQLTDEKSQLSKQAQQAQTEAQRAQGQIQAAQAEAAQAAQQAQAQALARAQAATAPQSLPPNFDTNLLSKLTPEQLAAFNARYGSPASPEGQTRAQVNGCVNNLRQIDSAKQQWALENAKPPQSIPNPQDIAPYIRGNVLPKCPGGGTYTLNSLEMMPTCTIPGHALQ